MTTSNTGQMREAFETWFREKYHSRLDRNMPDKSYNDPTAYTQWIAWQAALSSASSGAGVLTVDDMARVLQAAWAKAEPGHGVTLNPASYWATFADMARAALAATQRAEPVAQSGVEGLRDIAGRLQAIAADLKGREPDTEEAIFAVIDAINAAPPAAAQAAAAPRMVTVRHYNVDGTETLHQRPAASPAPAAEADDASRPDIIERLTYHEYERDDMTLDDVLDYLASGWKKVHGRTERQLILQLCALLAARPAAPLSEVKS
jgi:hypothetical protein